MTDSDFMLMVLSDGAEHSTLEIIQRSIRSRGCGLTPHSRADDLRKRGHRIDCDYAGKQNGRPVWVYRLVDTSDLFVASPPTPPLSVAASLLEDIDGKHDHDGGRGGAEGEGEQESLFTLPRSPAWS